MPIVSVITPCYNSRQYIAANIQSVLGQTMEDWEQVVVDDGSTDAPGDVVCPLVARDARIRLIRQANLGVAAARNAGYGQSDSFSKYLLFLDADDVLCPEMLSVAVEHLDAHPDVGMVHFAHYYVDGAGDRRPTQDWHIGNMHRYVPALGGWGVAVLGPDTRETPFLSVFCHAGIVPSVCVIRRSIYRQTPGWDEEFGQHYEDTDLLLHIALRSPVHFIARRMVGYRRHDAQNTADPARFGHQEAKLYRKWASMTGLTSDLRQEIHAANRFRTRRLIPWKGWNTGIRCLAKGQLLDGLRFCGGALRRYFVGPPEGM